MTIFDGDRHWLERQPGMNDWETGCARLEAQLTQWLSDYSRAFCASTIGPDHESHRRCLERLWKCWSDHWQSALEAHGVERFDGGEVSASIRAGRGYKGAGQLGGDPLRDIVLAESVTRGDERSI
jgi:hypothetical protein